MHLDDFKTRINCTRMILKKRMSSSYSSKSSLGKIACAARNLINSVPQTAATTFAFSLVFILLLWRFFYVYTAPGVSGAGGAQQYGGCWGHGGDSGLRNLHQDGGQISQAGEFHGSNTYRRRIKTEEKAKVIAVVWETELIQILAVIAILHQDDLKKGYIQPTFLYCPGAILPILQIVLVQNS